MNELTVIDTRALFRKNTEELLKLLPMLTRDQWSGSTCYPQWNVKDIAAHLLQSGLTRLSRQRDGFPDKEPLPPLSFNEILNLISNGNDNWQEIFSSVSPELIVGLLSHTEYALSTFFENLPLLEEAPFSVAWAGEEVSQNWFDMAREWTERWHHHQQIREAVGAPGMTQPEYLHPVIDTLIRAVPWWYSTLDIDDGVQILIDISGDAGGCWTLLKETNAWVLYSGTSSQSPSARIGMSADTAWRFLTRTISPDQTISLMEFSGDLRWAKHFLKVKAIMMPG